MRELTKKETQQVNGGSLLWRSGVTAISPTSIASYPPMAMGLPYARNTDIVHKFMGK